MIGQMRRLGERTLGLLSLFFGLIATGGLSLAVSTEYWLHTTENIQPYIDNETRQVMEAENIPVPTVMRISAHSGLWRCCILHADSEEGEERDEGLPPEECYNVAYFSQGNERFEEADTTNSIMRAIRKSSPLPVLSLLLSMVALALSIAGTTTNDFKTIVSAVVYIFSALLLGMGVIVYISAVNDEVSHRRKTESSNETDRFTFHYRYGWAFIFMGSTFICSLLAAVGNISFYLHRYAAMEDKLLIHPGNGSYTPGDLGYYQPVNPGEGGPTPSVTPSKGLMTELDYRSRNHSVSIVL